MANIPELPIHRRLVEALSRTWFAQSGFCSHTSPDASTLMLKTLIAFVSPLRRLMSSVAMSASRTPIEDALKTKITEALKPTLLEIHNDSHLHSHHKAMVGSTSKETHFRVTITSSAFDSKPQPARHRMVYALMKDEMAAEGGIHALQLRTRTPAEETKAAEREKKEKEEKGAVEESAG